MSQAGIVDFEGSHPQVPTNFVTNSGTAVPIGNTLEVLGTIVNAHGIPLQTTGSGNTVTIQTQYSSASGSSSGTNAGLASFSSTYFTVDSNGFVTLNGSALGQTITGNTGGALSPIAGNWNILGTSTTAGAIPVQTSGSGNTLTVQVQKSQAVASTNASNVGLSAFNSGQFTVDPNGFVSLVGGSGQAIQTINSTPPNASGNFNLVTANTTLSFSASTNTSTLNFSNGNLLLGATAPGITTATFNVALGPFAMQAITSAQQCVAIGEASLASLTTGSFNTSVGQGSLQLLTTGVSNTACGQNALSSLLTGGGNTAIGEGAGSSYTGTESSNVLIGNVGVVGESHVIRIGTQGSSGQQQNECFIAGIEGVSVTSPVGLVNVNANGQLGSVVSTGFVQTITGNDSVAESPSSGNFNIVGSGSITTAGSAATETIQLTGLTNHAVLVGAGTATITKVGPSATVGQIFQSNGSSLDPSYSTATYPSTTTINQILFSSSANTVTGLTAGNNGVLISSAAGVPSWLSDGTTGQVLTATTGSPPSWVSPATSGTVTNVTGTANQVAVATGTTTPVISLIGPYTPSTYTAHGVILGEGTSSMVATSAGTSGQLFQSGGASADGSWTTATYPATTTINQLLYSSAANTVTGLATANNGVLTTSSAGVPSVTAISASNLLATNAAGTIASRAFSINRQVFTSSGTYTPSTGMLYCDVQIVGGGGGGGGTAATSATIVSAAGGGGAGGYAQGRFSAATIGVSTVTIGAAGAAGAAGNNSGGTGGTSSVGALISATGGIGGGGGSATAFSLSSGGAGGVGSGGDFATTGQPGGWGFSAITVGTFELNLSGFGGSSFFGGGAIQASNSAGVAANSAGGGGSGASAANVSAAAQAGGAGFKGIVIVTEYIIN
jgi:hypothetical protein